MTGCLCFNGQWARSQKENPELASYNKNHLPGIGYNAVQYREVTGALQMARIAGKGSRAAAGSLLHALPCALILDIYQ